MWISDVSVWSTRSHTFRISVLFLPQVYAGYLEHTDTQDGKVIEDLNPEP